jgi:hypothetical protein
LINDLATAINEYLACLNTEVCDLHTGPLPGTFRIPNDSSMDAIHKTAQNDTSVGYCHGRRVATLCSLSHKLLDDTLVVGTMMANVALDPLLPCPSMTLKARITEDAMFPITHAVYTAATGKPCNLLM